MTSIDNKDDQQLTKDGLSKDRQLSKSGDVDYDLQLSKDQLRMYDEQTMELPSPTSSVPTDQHHSQQQIQFTDYDTAGCTHMWLIELCCLMLHDRWFLPTSCYNIVVCAQKSPPPKKMWLAMCLNFTAEVGFIWKTVDCCLWKCLWNRLWNCLWNSFRNCFRNCFRGQWGCQKLFLKQFLVMMSDTTPPLPPETVSETVSETVVQCDMALTDCYRCYRLIVYHWQTSNVFCPVAVLCWGQGGTGPPPKSCPGPQFFFCFELKLLCACLHQCKIVHL